ncbi:MAG TPA: anti-sigma factor [Candidatus Dormibacteraeota bacterium]|nr:anti-sigma factor [Candidatus Dormibacteraeota bacterium]
MSCELAKGVLHGYLDNELDAARAAEFERHLEGCRECAGALGSGEALRASLQGAGLYERAPAALRDRVRAELKAATKNGAAKPAAQPAWRWLAVAASILIVGTMFWLALPSLTRPPLTTNLLAVEMIDAHVRSLQAGHLTDVTSTDQHTVRPWFDGKLDFIPPVKDYPEEGFTLIGGRLDALTGRSVAALVYMRRKHYVNVFVWPTQDADTPIHPPGSRQGYNWVHWRHKGMEFCAVSDASPSDLHELAQLINQ